MPNYPTEQVNDLQLSENPSGTGSSNLEELIQRQKFLESSVSVGTGEENLTVMPDEFRERRDLEQYFFTKQTIQNYINAFTMRYPDPEDLQKKLCLICCPSLAKAFYEQLGYTITCLDIDTRFD